MTCFAEAGGQHVPEMARAVQLLGLRACLTESIMDTGEGLPASWAIRTTDHCIQVLEFFLLPFTCPCIVFLCRYGCFVLVMLPFKLQFIILFSILFVEIMSLPGVHFFIKEFSGQLLNVFF